jgi:hypothetical protein
MADDDFMQEWIDPFDMLNEHEVMIKKLVRAHNAQEQVIANLLQHNSRLTDELIRISKRLTDVEKR